LGVKTLQAIEDLPILPKIKIGELQFDSPIFLAPLAGITDHAFRLICRHAGAGMVYTELISAEGVRYTAAKTMRLAEFHPDERPLGIQIFSHSPVALAEAAKKLEVLEPDLFDLNFGCPVKKVVKRGAGAGFMGDLPRLSEAVSLVVKATHYPVTVKMRSGPSDSDVNAVEAAQRSEDAGAAAVTVHGRTTAQGFKGKADWSIIARVKEAVKIPVIGNGDVNTPDDMQRMFSETGCDAVMIGRGILGNPWLFSDCLAALNHQPILPLSLKQKWELIELHLSAAYADKKAQGVREMRKHLGWYSRGMKGAAAFRATIFRIDDPQLALETARAFFLSPDEDGL
jgi:tRNA-dihydrouridine synthase B